MQNSFISEDHLQRIEKIINEIKGKSSNGNYIYRGERKPHDDISSALHREYREYINNKVINIDIEDINMRNAQINLLKTVKKHVGDSSKGALEDFADFAASLTRNRTFFTDIDELEILTELQHYGGRTNLIDFTTDYLIAIFFACAGHPEENGRVILLEKTEDIEKMIIHPQTPKHRVVVQKSIFLYPTNGVIDVNEDKMITIPAILKKSLLKYLRKYHDISTETIYNDIHGFITNQNIQHNAYIAYSIAETFHRRALKAKPPAERQEAYTEAIKHYNTAIEMNLEIGVAYANRGECRLHIAEWDQAKEDLRTASNMGVDIIASFHNDYKNAADFYDKIDIELPPEIAEMLGG